MDMIAHFKELDRHGYHVSDAGETLKAFALFAKTFVAFLIKPSPNLILWSQYSSSWASFIITPKKNNVVICYHMLDHNLHHCDDAQMSLSLSESYVIIINIITMLVCHHFHHHHHGHMSSYVWPEAQSRFMLCSLSHCTAAICTHIHQLFGIVIIIIKIIINIIIIGNMKTYSQLFSIAIIF